MASGTRPFCPGDREPLPAGPSMRCRIFVGQGAPHPDGIPVYFFQSRVISSTTQKISATRPGRGRTAFESGSLVQTYDSLAQGVFRVPQLHHIELSGSIRHSPSARQLASCRLANLQTQFDPLRRLRSRGRLLRHRLAPGASPRRRNSRLHVPAASDRASSGRAPGLALGRTRPRPLPGLEKSAHAYRAIIGRVGGKL
jgi:hypothetical protein